MWKCSAIHIAFTSCVFLSGCTGMEHIGYRCRGQTKSVILGKFGPPERVEKSIEDTETWEYTMGGGVKTYTFQGDACVKENSRNQR